MALRQRGKNKKGTKEALLPIVSVNTKQRRRRQRRTTHKGLHIIIIVVSFIVLFFTITFIYSFHAQNEITNHFQCSQYPHLKGFLNDDYCDCPDGSDEPLTSACSHLLVGQKIFLCTAPSTGEAIKLFPSRIQDGVVDCHDGSDEK